MREQISFTAYPGRHTPQVVALNALHSLLSGDRLSNPYPLYARLREQGPALRVACSPAAGVWLVSRYADVRFVLTHSAFSVEGHRARIDPDRPGVFLPDASPFSRSMFGADPPRHGRLRRLVSSRFTLAQVAQLRPRIEAITDALTSSIGTGRFDVVAGLAAPLPARVLGELLGVEAADHARFQLCAHQFNDAIGNPEAGAMLAAGESINALGSYFSRELRRRRSAPGADLISAMAWAQQSADPPRDAEIISTALLLANAGFETTTNLIASAVLALIEAPEQREILRGRPELLPGAIEEFLRFDSPLQAVVRVTRCAVEISGTELPEGALVLALIGSANRDPERFRAADQLQLEREDCDHLAFGGGRHHCLGTALAKLEAQLALAALLTRVRNWPCAPARLERRPSPIVRGIRSLVLEL